MYAWLKSIFERKSVAVDGWQALVDAGAHSAAGIQVSPTSALRCVPVMAGVRVRCETLGSLPVHVYERQDDGGKRRADKHPLYRLLHGMANPWTPSADLIMSLEMDSILYGAGYALANRSGDKIVELIRLQPTAVSVDIGDMLEPTYTVSLKNGGQRKYGYADILHIPALGGLSQIRQAADAVGLYLALERHGSRIFAAGGRPSGILQYGKRLTPESLKRLRESWDQQYAGESAGRTAVLEDGVTFEALTFKSVDLQFLELRAYQLVEIARALAVPPSLIADFSRATWSNSEQMAQAFLTFTILPRLKVWQGAISRLLSPEDQQTIYAEFLVDELVKAAIAERFEAYSKAVTNGILSPNEIRSMENRAPYPGGDEFRVPLNTEAPGKPDSAPKKKPRAVAA